MVHGKEITLIMGLIGAMAIFGQRFVDLLFRVIEVIEGIEETIVEVFLGHLVLGR